MLRVGLHWPTEHTPSRAVEKRKRLSGRTLPPSRHLAASQPVDNPLANFQEQSRGTRFLANKGFPAQLQKRFSGSLGAESS